MTKQMKEPSTNFLELDKLKIDEQIASSGEYSSDGVFVKKWILSNEEGEENTSQTDKELIKSNESKPLQIMYKTFYFNSDKKVIKI